MLSKLANLDAKDLAILRVLDQDVRASFTEIGRKTRLSKEVVQYRIKRLEEEKILTGYWTFIKYLQGSVYKILIKNKSLSGKIKEEFINYVKDHKIASWFAETEGNFDYLITVYTEEDIQMVDFSNELFRRFGSYFQERHILKSFETNITNEKYLYPNGKFIYELSNKFSHKDHPKDKTEDELLRILSLNSRSKYTEIAEKLKLTPEAIKYRFKDAMRLISGFKIRLNWQKLGLNYYHIFITFQDQSLREELSSFYKLHPDFNASMHHIGKYDIHIEIVLEPERINDFIEEFITKFGNKISGYELLRIRKEFVLHILK
ncbi:TPA: Lrp/AsnC family transcriptional regulator [Candidatus Woesearchaeota archaeon]|nr:Lrp/AsnC family transcriptional regulator [Candidatus Woesearchaeota archaeon]HIH31435.1 Lrp/AsnC family transcriptional regulator [Candidatus Woesearchaeota archaeon]HIH55304.1 Lrp/AsnC family transcriptional regulator [Candidatus Woesearchaeota archaeon]HIJ01281.1 Lrp/AsnC family transcriptional regulator [Candidatus Woesearchaeota archaeon]HIJ13686.1 Lrp/AsnC family transcriptional regulator [Candidatus Woesearchaeota archaeon]